MSEGDHTCATSSYRTVKVVASRHSQSGFAPARRCCGADPGSNGGTGTAPADLSSLGEETDDGEVEEDDRKLRKVLLRSASTNLH